jgi:hypothetical protein
MHVRHRVSAFPPRYKSLLECSTQGRIERRIYHLYLLQISTSTGFVSLLVRTGTYYRLWDSQSTISERGMALSRPVTQVSRKHTDFRFYLLQILVDRIVDLLRTIDASALRRLSRPRR